MLLVVSLSAVVSMGMAWAIGAQDVSNALGTAVGSKAVTVNQAILIGAICEFSGSLLGGSVAHTISKGIVRPDLVANIDSYVEIMFCTLCGAFVWLALATYLSLPVSTSHSLVGSLVGLASFVAPDALNASVLKVIIISWISSPIIGGVVAFMVFYVINMLVLSNSRPMHAAINIIPYLWGGTMSVLSLFLVVAGPSVMRMHSVFPAILLGAAVFGLSVMVSRRLTRRALKRLVESSDTITDEVKMAESLFVSLMIITACVVSFAHGSNDVSNSVGPFAAVYEVYSTGSANGQEPVPNIILIMGGLGIVVGLGSYGYKVMATVGERITKLTFSRGFAAQIATALTVLGASLIGLSVSTTHCLIGAIAGLALVEGRDKINTSTLRKIVISWIVTLPASALFSFCSYFILRIVSPSPDTMIAAP